MKKKLSHSYAAKLRPNPFIGRWRIVELHCSMPDGRWDVYALDHHQFIWEFSDVNRIALRRGGLAYCGVMREQIDDCEAFITRWAYYPNSNYFYVDSMKCRRVGGRRAFPGDRYAVGDIDESICILYDLYYAGVTPGDYWFKLILNKLR